MDGKVDLRDGLFVPRLLDGLFEVGCVAHGERRCRTRSRIVRLLIVSVVVAATDGQDTNPLSRRLQVES